MKILYIDINLKSLNPTNTFFSSVISSIGNVVRFGPGFSDPNELIKGIARFVEKVGPLDIVVLGPNMPIWAEQHEWPEAVSYIKKYTSKNSNPDLYFEFFKDVFSNLKNLPVKAKVGTLITFDNYAVNKKQVQRIESLGLHIIAPDKGFVQSVDEFPKWAKYERHFNKSVIFEENWRSFVNSNSQKIISGLHFVSEVEFRYDALSNRKNLVNVPGALYHQRKKAKQLLEDGGFTPTSLSKVEPFKVLNKLGFPVYSNSLALEYYRARYQSGLENSQFCFAARGGFGLLVRKFLEIPAAGSVLFGIPPVGFSAMGFVDGLHYVQCDSEHVCEVLAALSKDFDNAQNLVNNAQELIIKNHTISARCEQFKSCFEHILAGDFNGSHWKDGQFIIERSKCVE